MKKANDLNEDLAIETKAMHRAAQDMAAMEIAKNTAAEKEAETKNQEERERLIAEAYRLAGRAEAFNAIAEFANVSTLLQLKKIKDSKIYKEISNIGTWENYCKSIGFSRAKIDLDLDNLEMFGETFIANVSSLGIGYRELRQLKRAKTDGILSIEENSVVIEGETIALGDKDELKEALEDLVAQQQRKLKEKDAVIAEKETEIDAVEKQLNAERERKDHVIREKERAWEEADVYKKRFEAMNKGELSPVALEDIPDFNKIREMEDRFAVVYHNILMLADADLSPFNQQMLGGLIGLILRAADDTRLMLQGKSGIYFEGSALSDAEMEGMGNLLTPNTFENKNEE